MLHPPHCPRARLFQSSCLNRCFAKLYSHDRLTKVSWNLSSDRPLKGATNRRLKNNRCYIAIIYDAVIVALPPKIFIQTSVQKSSKRCYVSHVRIMKVHLYLYHTTSHTEAEQNARTCFIVISNYSCTLIRACKAACTSECTALSFEEMNFTAVYRRELREPPRFIPLAIFKELVQSYSSLLQSEN